MMQQQAYSRSIQWHLYVRQALIACGMALWFKLLTALVHSGHTLEKTSAVHLHQKQGHVSTSVHICTVL